MAKCCSKCLKYKTCLYPKAIHSLIRENYYFGRLFKELLGDQYVEYKSAAGMEGWSEPRIALYEAMAEVCNEFLKQADYQDIEKTLKDALLKIVSFKQAK